MKEGALSAKFKEIIAVAVAHATQCPYCIDVHTKNAAKAGATNEELFRSSFGSFCFTCRWSLCTYGEYDSKLRRMVFCPETEIISIAREVIHSKGYQASSINDILQAAHIVNDNFIITFLQNMILAVAVVEDLIQEWNQQLIVEILQSTDKPKCKIMQNVRLGHPLSYRSSKRNLGFPLEI